MYKDGLAVRLLLHKLVSLDKTAPQIPKKNIPDVPDGKYSNTVKSLNMASTNNPEILIIQHRIAWQFSPKWSQNSKTEQRRLWDYDHLLIENIWKSGIYYSCLLSLEDSSTKFSYPLLGNSELIQGGPQIPSWPERTVVTKRSINLNGKGHDQGQEITCCGYPNSTFTSLPK